MLELAGVLVDRKTISGDDVAEVMGTPQGARTIHEPAGFVAYDPDDEGGLDVAGHQSIPSMPRPNLKPEDEDESSPNGEAEGSDDGEPPNGEVAKPKKRRRSKKSKAEDDEVVDTVD